MAIAWTSILCCPGSSTIFWTLLPLISGRSRAPTCFSIVSATQNTYTSCIYSIVQYSNVLYSVHVLIVPMVLPPVVSQMLHTLILPPPLPEYSLLLELSLQSVLIRWREASTTSTNYIHVYTNQTISRKEDIGFLAPFRPSNT